MGACQARSLAAAVAIGLGLNNFAQAQDNSDNLAESGPDGLGFPDVVPFLFPK
jgi:hypothetical protein